MKCDRCGGKTSYWRMSWFDAQLVCLECAEEERNHPSFEDAKREVCDRERLGDRNYKGIGLPDDLKERYSDPSYVELHRKPGKGKAPGLRIF